MRVETPVRPPRRWGITKAERETYARALVVAWLSCAVLMVLPNLGGYDAVGVIAIAVVYVPLLVFACAIGGLPVWLAVVLTLHYGLRPVRWSGVHVVAAGLAAAGAGALWMHVVQIDTIDDFRVGWAVFAIGISAAFGRLMATTEDGAP